MGKKNNVKKRIHYVMLYTCIAFPVIASQQTANRSSQKALELMFDPSYDDTRVKELQAPNIQHARYGFDNNQVALTYNEKNERGVVHLVDGTVLQRLKISKTQFSTIDNIFSINNNFSIVQLPDNQQTLLATPLYLIANDSDRCLLYKINYLTKRKRCEISEAEYNSDSEQHKNELIGAFTAGLATATFFGGMAATFMFLFCKLYYVLCRP